MIHVCELYPYFLQMKGASFIYNNYEEAEQAFLDGKAIKIVNPRQIGFYSIWDCQPDFVWQGYDEKLIAYYEKVRTHFAWRKWQENRPTKVK